MRHLLQAELCPKSSFMVCCYFVAGQMDLFMQDQEKAILDDNEVSEDADPVAIGGEYHCHAGNPFCLRVT
jgi:hypothetical protein